MTKSTVSTSITVQEEVTTSIKGSIKRAIDIDEIFFYDSIDSTREVMLIFKLQAFIKELSIKETLETLNQAFEYAIKNTPEGLSNYSFKNALSPSFKTDNCEITLVYVEDYSELVCRLKGKPKFDLYDFITKVVTQLPLKNTNFEVYLGFNATS